MMLSIDSLVSFLQRFSATTLFFLGFTLIADGLLNMTDSTMTDRHYGFHDWLLREHFSCSTPTALFRLRSLFYSLIIPIKPRW